MLKTKSKVKKMELFSKQKKNFEKLLGKRQIHRRNEILLEAIYQTTKKLGKRGLFRRIRR